MSENLSKLKITDIRQNQLQGEDSAFHDWYRFILSFPPHLIRDYFRMFKVKPGALVLDPFCGTGTTVVEAKKMGISAIGQEAHPMSHFASSVKTNWRVSPKAVRRAIDGIQDRFDELLGEEFRGFSEAECEVLVEGSISDLPLHKVLCLRKAIDGVPEEDVRNLCRLLLARTAVLEASNLHFAPEVTVVKKKADADVWSDWHLRMTAACDDLETFERKSNVSSKIFHTDSRSASRLEEGSISFVFTSPPYPNEKDYTRTTRLESVLLGFITNKKRLREVKDSLLRSNTRNIYKTDGDDAYVLYDPFIEKVASEIEKRRTREGKDSGFERLYAKVAKMYFGGMMRHFVELKPKLTPEARLCYVVGDQASFLRVHIKTGEILAELADRAGYEFAGLEVFRERFSTVTQDNLREEVLILKNRPAVVQIAVNGLRDLVAKDHQHQSNYDQIIVSAFEKGLNKEALTSRFDRVDIAKAAEEAGVPLPANLGDVLYAYRYRRELPEGILKYAPEGKEWVIRSKGRGQYEFELASISRFYANPSYARIKIKDNTPDAFRRIPISDQQLLLAIVRINGLISKFTDTKCELLGSHFRSMVKGTGQVMTDEVYLGSAGNKISCFPVQARPRQESLSVVQIEQDMKMCEERFPGIVCRPIGVQLVSDNVVALLEFVRENDEVRLKREAHYELA